MCGILFIIEEAKSQIDDSLKQKIKKLCHFIDQRGPEYQSKLCRVNPHGLNIKIHHKSSVLSFRTENIQKQPLISQTTKNILLFNGQIYSYREHSNSFVDLSNIDPCKSDVEFLLERLDLCCKSSEVLHIITRIRGPFAITFWHNRLQSLFYGRDIFGRRSLCITSRTQGNYPMIISSIGPNHIFEGCDLTWSEVPANGVYELKFNQNDEMNIDFHEWDLKKIYHGSYELLVSGNYNTSSSVLSCPLTEKLNTANIQEDKVNDLSDDEILLEFEKILLKSVSRRVDNARTSCLDCRKSRHKCCHAPVAIGFSGGIDSTLIAYLVDKVVEEDKPIDLLNVAFQFDAPDRISGLLALKELQGLCPNRKWNFVCCDVSVKELREKRDNEIKHLISPRTTVIDDSLGCSLWFVARGVGNPLDSTISEDEINLPSISNLETKLKSNMHMMDSEPSKETLKKIFKPHSVSDKFYTSPASILILGMGIDEQLGGYSSHRNAWIESRSNGVNAEISKQMLRISGRNSGRDDRVCACFGRDMRAVFLDEELVDFLNSLPLSAKMNFDSTDQQRFSQFGSKQLLRKLAIKFGFLQTSKRIKRAMQFGTRIAKLESRSEQGSDQCLRL